MSLNPLAPVTDYYSMLNRIFVFTWLWACLATWIVRLYYEPLDQLLKKLDFPIDILGLKEMKILGYIVPGLVVSVLARMVKLHDRISDVLRIREQFDLYEIILPLARGAGVSVGKLTMDQLRRHRGKLMSQVFYRYASSTDPKIDKHAIYQALDWWSWYWVFVEMLAVLLPTGTLLLFFGSSSWPGLLLLVACAAVILIILPFFRVRCSQHADYEVDLILTDQTRKQEIEQAFSALPN
jgi:hypothetical protein